MTGIHLLDRERHEFAVRFKSDEKGSGAERTFVFRANDLATANAWLEALRTAQSQTPVRVRGVPLARDVQT